MLNTGLVYSCSI